MNDEGDTDARIIRPAKGLTDAIETVSGVDRLEHSGVASLPDGRVLVSDEHNTLILSTWSALSLSAPPKISCKITPPTQNTPTMIGSSLRPTDQHTHKEPSSAVETGRAFL